MIDAERDEPRSEDLIHDWNREAGDLVKPAQPVEFDDETLRDGLQSPSVTDPTIEQKIEILHLMDGLGIHTADIGLPGAGPRAAADVTRLAQEIADARLTIAANCAARTVKADIDPVVEISQKTGIAIECCTFIGSSPIRQYAEGWDLDWIRKTSEEAVSYAVARGAKVMYVTEDTTRARPDALEKLYTTAIEAGASRICLADTVGHATPDGARNLVRWAKRLVAKTGADVKVDWHGHRDRGFGLANALAAMVAGADRVHAHRARDRRAGREHGDGPPPPQPRPPRLARARPVVPAALLPAGRRVDRRAAPAQLSGRGRGRVPDRHRRPRGGGDQGGEERATAGSRTGSIRVSRRVSWDASRGSKSATCRGSRTSYGGSSRGDTPPSPRSSTGSSTTPSVPTTS